MTEQDPFSEDIHKEYAQRMRFDDDALATYEYLSDSGSYRIDRLTPYQVMILCDELEEAGEDRGKWESVLQRWALGYRPHQ